MPKYLVRLILIFALGITSAVVIRGFFVPKSFGQLGHYRAAALGEVAARTPNFAGRIACDECHEELNDPKLTHAKVSCETCHGVSKEHSESEDDPEKFHLLKGLDDAAFCLKCHEKDIVRPADMPQIDSKTHKVEEKETCLQCHPMHKPDENVKKKP